MTVNTHKIGEKFMAHISSTRKLILLCVDSSRHVEFMQYEVLSDTEGDTILGMVLTLGMDNYGMTPYDDSPKWEEVLS